MSLHKIVNGVQIGMTPEEDAEIRAEWARNDALPIEQPDPVITARQLRAALVVVGIPQPKIDAAMVAAKDVS